MEIWISIDVLLLDWKVLKEGFEYGPKVISWEIVYDKVSGRTKPSQYSLNW